MYRHDLWLACACYCSRVIAPVYSVILCYVGFIHCVSVHAQLIDGVSLVLWSRANQLFVFC